MVETKAKQADFRHIVRVANTDLEGAKPIKQALTKIKGVGFVFANATCKLSGVDETKKTGELSAAEVDKRWR